MSVARAGATWAPWIAGLALALPVLAVRYPPMGDLAMHEALVAILRHRGDAAWAPWLYFVVAPQANQLFHWLACALAYVVPTDLACKLVVAGCVFGCPPLAARALARTGASTWPALLVAPVACGWIFRWGLVANLLGLTLLLAFVPTAERLARRPDRRAIAASVGAACAIFFAHESSALLFAAITGLFAITRGTTARGIAARAAPAAVCLGLAAAQWRASAGLLGPTMRAIGTSFGLDPLERLAILPGAIFGGRDTVSLAILGVAWGGAVVAFGARRARGATRAPRPARVALWTSRYAVLGAAFFLLYLVFPMSMGGTTLLAHRFLAGAAACAALACAPRSGRAPCLGVALACAAPIATLAALAKPLADADRSYRALDAILARVPDGVAVAQLDLTPRPPGHVAPVVGAASRELAVHGGRMLFAMTDMPPNPVYTRAEHRWDEPVLRMASQPFAFMPSWDARRFSYVIVHEDRPELVPLLAQAMAPEEELVETRGPWTLFRSTVAVEPLDAPDRALPVPPPETLADRIDAIVPARP
jgi:hypothetical protein